ncbi:MAG: hypothetical protein LDL27_03475 [Desulfovibrio sp.]|nr:hypothetical protein [Desulfovibrio sp.]
MFKITALHDWLERLRILHPIVGVVHVGASLPAAEQYAQWNVARVTFVEAQASKCAALAPHMAGRSGWGTVEATVADSRREVVFHLASNPDESGLTPPESLRSVWQNLAESGQERREAVPLASLLTSEAHAACNWLVVDCFPAVPVLAGLGERLAGFDVVLCRALMGDRLLPKAGITQAAIATHLKANGFKTVMGAASRHPQVGYVLHVRNWRAQCDVLEAQRLAAHTTAQEKDKLLQERQERIDTLTKEKAALAQEKDKLLQERQARIDTLTKEKAALATERNTANNQIKTLQGKLEELEKNHLDLGMNSELLKEELFKAEGQIELIKDLLLPRVEPLPAVPGRRTGRKRVRG